MKFLHALALTVLDLMPFGLVGVKPLIAFPHPDESADGPACEFGHFDESAVVHRPAH